MHASHARMQAWLAGAIIALYAVALAMGPGPGWVGDSVSYKDPSMAHDLQSAVDSILGQHSRPWPVVVLFEAVGDLRAIVLVQTAIACAASIYLTLGFFVVTGSARRALIGALVALTVLLSPWFISFTTLVLSESLTLSAITVALGAAIRICVRPTSMRIVVLLVSGMTALFIRPLLAPVFVVLLFVLVRSMARTREHRGHLMLLVAASAVVAVTVTAWWTTSVAFARASYPWPAVSAAYNLSDYSPLAPALRATLQAENPTPDCFPIDAGLAADGRSIWTPLYALHGNDGGPGCPAGVAWSDTFTRWQAVYLLEHPSELVGFAAWALPRSLSSPQTPAGISVVPRPVTEALLGTMQPAYSTGTRAVGTVDPHLSADPALLLLGLGTIAALAVRPRPSRGRLLVAGAGIGVAWAALVTAILGAVAIPSNLLEMARIGAPANLVLRLGLIIAAIGLWEAARPLAPTR